MLISVDRPNIDRLHRHTLVPKWAEEDNMGNSGHNIVAGCKFMSALVKKNFRLVVQPAF